MEANELRIGNHAYKDYPSGLEIIKVKNIHGHIINGLGIGAIKPIPLTEEWLLKFGFEKFVYEDEDVGYGTEYKLKASQDVFMVYSDDFSVGLYSDEYGEKNDIAVIPTFENNKYVHQLQNLYFALTGKELIP
jgi:hypothetical protein